jgi:hypothetical protein
LWWLLLLSKVKMPDSSSSDELSKWRDGVLLPFAG